MATAQHPPVSLGTANGLSLADGQILSLGLASTITTGALSSTEMVKSSKIVIK